MPKNKIEDLRNHLFEAMEKLQCGDMDIETAKAMSGLGNTIIQTAKVEVDFIRAIGGDDGSKFWKEQQNDNIKKIA